MKGLCFFIAFILLAVSAEAKTLYVDSTIGNDSATYITNNENNPWATIGRAAWGSTNRSSPNSSEAAQAGDTVIVKAGTYNASASSGVRYQPAYNPANSGTAGNYITFRAQGAVTLQSTNGTGPVIGSENRDYIIWDGFYIDEANVNTTSDTGPVVVWDADHVTIQNCEINGAGTRWADNHKGIAIQAYSTNITIKNNKIYEFTTTGVNANNGAGIQVYNSYNLIIENNEIHSSGSGIFLKELISGPIAPITIRYNLIYNIGQAGIVLHRLSEGTNVKVYQNIIRDSVFGIRFWGFSGGVPNRVSVVNNTIDNCTQGGVYLSGGAEHTFNLFKNNIITNSSTAIYADDVQTQYIGNNYTDFEHNNYYGNTTHARVYYISYTFSSWQNTFSQDSDNPASITSNPLYLNESINNFTLKTSSPSICAGSDILDLDEDSNTTDSINMGAYVTGNEQIGIPSQFKLRLLDYPSCVN